MGRSKVGFALLAGVAGLGAATLEAQELEIGVRGGYGRSNEVTTTIICALDCGPSQLSHHFPRNAPVGAIVLRHQRTARLALRWELAFSPTNCGPGDERSDWRVAAQYLEAPVLVDVALLPIGRGQLMLSGGLAPAVLLSCRGSGSTVEGRVLAGYGESVRYAPDLTYDLGLRSQHAATAAGRRLVGEQLFGALALRVERRGERGAGCEEKHDESRADQSARKRGRRLHGRLRCG
jgi:hypothetical protein